MQKRGGTETDVVGTPLSNLRTVCAGNARSADDKSTHPHWKKRPTNRLPASHRPPVLNRPENGLETGPIGMSTSHSQRPTNSAPTRHRDRQPCRVLCQGQGSRKKRHRYPHIRLSAVLTYTTRWCSFSGTPTLIGERRQGAQFLHFG